MQLASQKAGASKLLVVPKKNTGGSTVKIGGGSSMKLGGGSSMKLKVPTSSKLRVNKFGVSKISNNEDDGFEDIAVTQQKAADAVKEAKQMEDDEALARKLQDELNSGLSSVPPPSYTAPAPAPVPDPVVSKPVATSSEKFNKSSMENNMLKMKSMTNDFFSQM